MVITILFVSMLSYCFQADDPFISSSFSLKSSVYALYAPFLNVKCACSKERKERNPKRLIWRQEIVQNPWLLCMAMMIWSYFTQQAPMKWTALFAMYLIYTYAPNLPRGTPLTCKSSHLFHILWLLYKTSKNEGLRQVPIIIEWDTKLISLCFKPSNIPTRITINVWCAPKSKNDPRQNDSSNSFLCFECE